MDLAFQCVAVVTGGIVVGSPTWSPAVFRPIPTSAIVLARVDVCIARVACVFRAISLLVLVFIFCHFPLPVLREYTVGFAQKFQEEKHHCNKVVRSAAPLA